MICFRWGVGDKDNFGSAAIRHKWAKQCVIHVSVWVCVCVCVCVCVRVSVLQWFPIFQIFKESPVYYSTLTDQSHTVTALFHHSWFLEWNLFLLSSYIWSFQLVCQWSINPVSSVSQASLVCHSVWSLEWTEELQVTAEASQ